MEPMNHSNLLEQAPVKPRRRRHSKAFKAKVLAACAEPGASIATVAQRYQITANLVHKWRKTFRERDQSNQQPPEFVSIPLATPTDRDITVTLILGELTIQWPLSHINQAIPWLKALQS